MIFFLFIMASGGIAATGGPLVFHYWKTPYVTQDYSACLSSADVPPRGAFNNGIKGIAKAFVQAGFSFGGGSHIVSNTGNVALTFT